MSKSFLKYALAGVAACLSLSAMQTSNHKEIAMVKCSKDNGYSSQEERGAYDLNQKRKESSHPMRRENDRDDGRVYYSENRYEPRCSEQRCCGSKYCFADQQGNAGYTLDSAGRRRCIPNKKREYNINKQKNCDEKGRCQESTQFKNTPYEMDKGIAEVERKSAARKVLEGN